MASTSSRVTSAKLQWMKVSALLGRSAHIMTFFCPQHGSSLCARAMSSSSLTPRRAHLYLIFLLQDISVLPCPIVQAGTTWTQRIVQLLRCGADISKDSRNVWEALPWLEAVWTVMLLCALLCPDSLVAGSCGHGSGSRGFPASVQEVWMV